MNSASVSIVIPVYDNCFYTRLCLDGLLAMGEGESPLEVIVVDNGSRDDTPRLLDRYSRRFPAGVLRAVRHAENLGFARGCNSGAEVARGSAVLFLNNDLVLEPAALASMVALALESPGWGAIGARLLYPDGTIWCAGIGFDEGGEPRPLHNGGAGDLAEAAVDRELQAVAGACILIDQPLFLELGGFDTVFQNSFEDVDLCLKIRASGRKVFHCGKAVGHHFASATAGRFSRDERNRRIYLDRWKSSVIPDLSEETTPERRPRLLADLMHLELQRLAALARRLSLENERLARLVSRATSSPEGATGTVDLTYEPSSCPSGGAGAVVIVPVVVRNLGGRSWAPRQLRLSYHWRASSSEMVQWEGLRTEIELGLPSGGATCVAAQVKLPEGPGRYELEWDALEEGVAWMSTLGVAPFRQCVVVPPFTGSLGDVPVELRPAERLDVAVVLRGACSEIRSLRWRWIGFDEAGMSLEGREQQVGPIDPGVDRWNGELVVVTPGEPGQYGLELAAMAGGDWVVLESASSGHFVLPEISRVADGSSCDRPAVDGIAEDRGTEHDARDRRPSGPAVVCILGMHRSGTSMIARCLNHLGVDLGETRLVGHANAFNPSGYWEHPAVVEINDRLLSRFGGRWDDPPALPVGWADSSRVADLRQLAGQVLDEHFSGSQLWGWKDPRTCLTMPFWQTLIQPINYVLCLRDPREVAASLHRRDALSREKAERLWLTYVRASLFATEGSPRILVFYPDVIDDWMAQSRRLASFVGRSGRLEDPGVQRSIGDFVNADLRHHDFSLVDGDSHEGRSSEADRLYRALRTDGRRSLASAPAADPLVQRQA